jgi:hypothetical protein
VFSCLFIHIASGRRLAENALLRPASDAVLSGSTKPFRDDQLLSLA